MDDADVAPARHRLTVDDYHRMGEAGIAEVWIVDIKRRAVDAYRRPDGG